MADRVMRMKNDNPVRTFLIPQFTPKKMGTLRRTRKITNERRKWSRRRNASSTLVHDVINSKDRD